MLSGWRDDNRLNWSRGVAGVRARRLPVFFPRLPCRQREVLWRHVQSDSAAAKWRDPIQMSSLGQLLLLACQSRGTFSHGFLSCQLIRQFVELLGRFIQQLGCACIASLIAP